MSEGSLVHAEEPGALACGLPAGWETWSSSPWQIQGSSETHRLVWRHHAHPPREEHAVHPRRLAHTAEGTAEVLCSPVAPTTTLVEGFRCADTSHSLSQRNDK